LAVCGEPDVKPGRHSPPLPETRNFTKLSRTTPEPIRIIPSDFTRSRQVSLDDRKRMVRLL
jgi:hypothetical protein